MIFLNKLLDYARGKQNKNGFSLVEAIVYLAIVGILLTATVSLHLTLGGTADKMSSNILASRNRRVAMGGIDYLIKNADGLLKDVEGDCSSFGATPPVLALYFENDNNLPGTCVANGGGVRISVSDKKVSMSCYPNMIGNGYYQNCDTSVYPAVNIYHLSSPDVAVLNSSLNFSTSTATSTANNFMTLTTNLSVGTHSNNQIRLTANSVATSTVIMRNEVASGLISWWTFEGGASVDSQGSNDLTCPISPSTVTGLINDSDDAFDFESSSSNFCYALEDDSLNFNNAFSITAWVNEKTTGATRAILNKSDASSNKGYALFIDSGVPKLRIYDSDSYTDYDVDSYTLTAGTAYHIAATYDLDNDEVIFYVYKKAVGGVATTTLNSLKTLVNYSGTLNWSLPNYFDGVIDDVRVYNRVLSAEEIWALQSQGAS